jgi:hypothetical protein
MLTHGGSLALGEPPKICGRNDNLAGSAVTATWPVDNTKMSMYYDI